MSHAIPLGQTNYYIYPKVIAKGTSAKVYKGYGPCNNQNIDLVFKKINMTKMKEQFHHYVHYEIKILQSISHPYIIKYIDHIEMMDNGNHYIFIVFEYFNGTDLADKLADVFDKLSLEEQLIIYRKICEAVKYLHEKQIVHRDIKPANIMVNLENDYEVKLIDFGFSTRNEESEIHIMETLCGTPAYMAPEILLRQTYNKTIDVWSLGVILYHMNTGVVPFYECENIPNLKQLYKNKIYPKHMYEMLNEKLHDIVSYTMDYDSNNRIFIHDLLYLVDELLKKIIKEKTKKEIVTTPSEHTIDLSSPQQVGSLYENGSPHKVGCETPHQVETISSSHEKEIRKSLIKRCSSNYLDEYDCIDDLDMGMEEERNNYMFYKQNLLLVIDHVGDLLDPVYGFFKPTN